MPSANLLLAVLVPLCIWVMVLAFVLAVLLAINDGIQRLRRLHQVPCFRCRYYTGSSHLKCPVRPIDAASEAALHCIDYEAVDLPPLHSPSQPRLRKRLLLLFSTSQP
ncbi:hypothetical protein IQ273_24315 [Nodosilinea sp. LEGE 07298]|uniref:hypothetical protein n=1 Tax=Nodosilinea sp. LEGE 07298 TaxID=2777970 RepID=UPI00188050C5|nr:hypothetical protein [Nodosilinea sp. LEGE 07298]MBE9112522.1 hypothetical protein [Nodosilinea sp. LEGE 07298]